MRRILIADANADNRILITDVLISLGYEVVGEALTVDDTITQARDLRPDLILLNRVGAEGDARLAAARIQAELPAITILVIDDVLRAGAHYD